MERESVPNAAAEVDEIARLREDNDALRGSALLWKRLYEGALLQVRQLQTDNRSDSTKTS
jgi:hypothetical protein